MTTIHRQQPQPTSASHARRYIHGDDGVADPRAGDHNAPLHVDVHGIALRDSVVHAPRALHVASAPPRNAYAPLRADTVNAHNDIRPHPYRFYTQ